MTLLPYNLVKNFNGGIKIYLYAVVSQNNYK